MKDFYLDWEIRLNNLQEILIGKEEPKRRKKRKTKKKDENL